MRTRFSENETITDLLHSTRKQFFEIHARQDYPFEFVVNEVAGKRDLSRNPIFDVAFIFQNFRLPDIQLTELQISERPFFSGAVNYDLAMEVTEETSGLKCSLIYASSLFQRNTVKRMADHFLLLAKKTLASPGGKIRKMPLISEDERHQILMVFNNTRAAYPENTTVAHLFEDRIPNFSQNIALKQGDRIWTYVEVNKTANRMARALRRHGLRSETVAALIMTSRPEVVVSILAIFKAGAAYLPIDPNSPPGRTGMMLQDTEALMILTDQDAIDQFNLPYFHVDDPGWW